MNLPDQHQLQRQLQDPSRKPQIIAAAVLTLVVLLLTKTLGSALLFGALITATLLARTYLTGQVRSVVTGVFAVLTAIVGAGLILTLTGKLVMTALFLAIAAAIAFFLFRATGVPLPSRQPQVQPHPLEDRTAEPFDVNEWARQEHKVRR